MVLAALGTAAGAALIYVATVTISVTEGSATASALTQNADFYDAENCYLIWGLGDDIGPAASAPPPPPGGVRCTIYCTMTTCT